MSEQTTVDWRALPAGGAVDRIIAERLGYTVHRGADLWYYLQAPDGSHVCNYCGIAALAWDGVPAYSTDANAALALWDNDSRWAVYPAWIEDKGRGKFCATFPGYGDQDAGDEYADTPALAIVRAWLQFTEKES